ncbi:MAG: ABC transporter ATP-binding protein [Defluviitaleaceae bacterium]|nr:ABC transporter ATP-binding protein [Defluviitaleaceae bacterium]
MSDFVIETENLEKVYGNKERTHALRGISIKVPRGSFCCIVGPSGHGKSTLLQLIGALDKPTSGRVSIDGVDISSLSDNKLSEVRSKKIGFVFQFFNLLENLTVKENIQTAMMFSKDNKKDTGKRALGLLGVVGLSDKANSKPSELSGGQLQRVAIARALANDPPILLMDEPTGNLDTESEKDVMEHIINIHKAGKTIVFVTHSNEIADRAELLFEIRDGKLKADYAE